MDFIQINFTIDDYNTAKKIIALLLDKNLIACGQIIKNVESHYWWNDKLEKSNEILCILKTKKELFGKIKNIIETNHSYEVPEIIAFQIFNGNKDYLEWIEKNLKPKREE